MPQINTVIVNGRLGGDPDIRYTPNGKAVAEFSIANHEGYGDNQSTNWIDVTVWAKGAEWVGENVSKGDEVLIQGKLRQETWEDRDGNQKSRLKVVAVPFGVNLMSAKRKSSDGANDNGWSDSGAQLPDEDIPF